MSYVKRTEMTVTLKLTFAHSEGVNAKTLHEGMAPVLDAMAQNLCDCGCSPSRDSEWKGWHVENCDVMQQA